MHQTMLCLPSVELTTSSTTQQNMVVQLRHIKLICLPFSGTNNFINNSAEYGGAVETYQIDMLTFNGTNNFINNMAGAGGAIYAQKSKLLSFTGTSSFCHNAAAEFGGAFYTEDNVIP